MIQDPPAKKENQHQFKDSVHNDAKRIRQHVGSLTLALIEAEDSSKSAEYGTQKIMEAGEIAEKIAKQINESLVRWK